MHQSPALNAAFKARDGALFSQVVNQCGEQDVVLLSCAVVSAAEGSQETNNILVKNTYENMMLVGLKRIVQLSTLESGLRLNNLRTDSGLPFFKVVYDETHLNDWELRKENISTCLNVIDGFLFEKNIFDILQSHNHEGVTFLAFCRPFLDRRDNNSFKNIRGVITKKFEKPTIEQNTSAEAIISAIKQGSVNVV